MSQRSRNQGKRHPKHKVRAVIRRLEDYFGVPKQQAADPTESIVRAILSQNTTDGNSARAYASLRKQFTTWEDLANARETAIARAIAVSGLANQKARTIKNLFKFLQHEWDSLTLDPITSLPDDEAIATLTQIPGIGIKTAAVTLLFSCRRDIFVVDTHVHRLCNRIGLVKTRARNETFRLMREIVPDGKSFSLHVNMIRLGREICRAQKPRCADCPVEKLCDRAGVA